MERLMQRSSSTGKGPPTQLCCGGESGSPEDFNEAVVLRRPQSVSEGAERETKTIESYDGQVDASKLMKK